MKENLHKQSEGRHDIWDFYLPMTQLQLNMRAASLHDSTPFSLFYGLSYNKLTDFSSVELHLLSDKELEDRLLCLSKKNV